jgi:hypothetical protein
MATSSKKGNARFLVEPEDREAVLAVISENPSVTIEELLRHLPWMRWGDLFSVLGGCLQEGLVILCQKEFQFEIRAVQPSQNEKDGVPGPFPSTSADRHMAI